ncbi:N-acetylgalactosamine kinase-like [Tigriopus californicus]|nr:N-acetylgalactosamine kinase-like [Tigriopus californicus]
MECPPVHQYPDRVRIDTLKHAHQTRYGSEPEIVVRVPGRVNLIGEHIDYCGYGVHPMAIDQDILVAVAKVPTRGTLQLTNLESKFADFETNLTNLKVQAQASWWNYFLCGVKGVLVELETPDSVLQFGLNCTVHGRIPHSAGLSSSSALVVAAALSTLWALDHQMAKKDLADLCARSERFIGTQGGGMDQATEILAKPGTALLIEFNPLRTQDVTLPQEANFVIVNSLADVNKAAGSDFNTRVVECRLATKVLAKLNNLSGWREKTKLIEFQEALNLNLEEALAKCTSQLHPEPYSKGELCQLLEMTTPELESQCLSPNTLDVANFDLFHRSKHVFSEAKRVFDFKSACDNSQDDKALTELGRLMAESHQSCSQDYECSHPALDQLVSLSKTAGALGSRLTGAGWGGCVVALVPLEKLDGYMSYIKEKYFANLAAAHGRDLNELIFTTQPGGGALTYTC